MSRDLASCENWGRAVCQHRIGVILESRGMDSLVRIRTTVFQQGNHLVPLSPVECMGLDLGMQFLHLLFDGSCASVMGHGENDIFDVEFADFI